MALEIIKTYNNGFSGNYHRVEEITWAKNSKLKIHVKSYKDKSSANLKLNFADEKVFSFNAGNYNADNILAYVYKLLKTDSYFSGAKDV